MKRTVLIAGCAIALAGTATTAFADRGEPLVMPYGEFQAVGQMADWVLPGDLLARRGRGADDPAGDDRGRGGHGADDGPNHTLLETPTLLTPELLARRGADDPAGDDRRGRGRGTDDGPGHTFNTTLPEMLQMAKNGADDGPDHDQDDDHGGRGGDDDDDDNGSGSGRDKPRIPGGSGCDDAGDVAEHAACRG
ncbi:hypothetical protein [Frigidibacter sp. RF13]|uniref:hypothetical protein n=1 Tax=Frigidibacter sp. RF13 TaxID=2997340 RepID=UPI002271E8CD|nr:hypothetical protein [Frigidibacter sp. RF13]